MLNFLGPRLKRQNSQFRYCLPQEKVIIIVIIIIVIIILIIIIIIIVIFFFIHFYQRLITVPSFINLVK